MSLTYATAGTFVKKNPKPKPHNKITLTKILSLATTRLLTYPHKYRMSHFQSVAPFSSQHQIQLYPDCNTQEKTESGPARKAQLQLDKPLIRQAYIENKCNIKISHGTRAFIMTCREVQSKCESKNKPTRQTQMLFVQICCPKWLGKYLRSLF